MELKQFYQKVRQVEAAIAGPDALVVSLETPDGGRAGVFTEAPRLVAALLVVEGRARLATPGEVDEHCERLARARAEAEQRAAAQRVQFAWVTENEFRKLHKNGGERKN
ncbi:MAG: hypothetical protein HYZ57_15985 [Acidobacteria bacterium]|nr:hypothetical protein [Acidobacteriota bacterium]